MNRLNTSLRDIKPKDLLFVILYGAVLSILVGFLIGFLDYYIQKFISFSFIAIFFFVSANFIGKQVRKQYLYPHIVYTVITGIFLVVQAIIILGLPIIFTQAVSLGHPEWIFEIRNYFTILSGFFQALVLHFNFNYIFLLLVFIIGTYLGVKNTY